MVEPCAGGHGRVALCGNHDRESCISEGSRIGVEAGLLAHWRTAEALNSMSGENLSSDHSRGWLLAGFLAASGWNTVGALRGGRCVTPPLSC